MNVPLIINLHELEYVVVHCLYDLLVPHLQMNFRDPSTQGVGEGDLLRATDGLVISGSIVKVTYDLLDRWVCMCGAPHTHTRTVPTHHLGDSWNIAIRVVDPRKVLRSFHSTRLSVTRTCSS